MTAFLVCHRCGGRQEARLADAEGLPLTLAEYRSFLAITESTIICDECLHASDTT